VKIPSAKEAEAVKLAGLQNQKEIFDFRNFTGIKTGGTGNVAEGVMSEAEVGKYLAEKFGI